MSGNLFVMGMNKNTHSVVWSETAHAFLLLHPYNHQWHQMVQWMFFLSPFSLSLFLSLSFSLLFLSFCVGLRPLSSLLLFLSGWQLNGGAHLIGAAAEEELRMGQGSSRGSPRGVHISLESIAVFDKVRGLKSQKSPLLHSLWRAVPIDQKGISIQDFRI